MKCKQLNLDRSKPVSKLRMWWWDTWLYSVVKEIGYFFRRLIRCIRWSKDVVNLTYDFDAHGCFILLRYQLEQVHRCIQNGYRAEPERNLKELKVAIRLLKRLEADDYEGKAFSRMEKKYGELNSHIDEKGYWHSNFGLETKDNKEAVRAEYLKLIQQGSKTKERDLKWFWQIFAKYSEGWWD